MSRSVSRGLSSGASIAGWRRAARFVADISSAASAGNSSLCRKPLGRCASLRKTKASGELLTISGSDPLNFAGILTPGPRVTAIAANRILLLDGVPLAGLEAGQIITLSNPGDISERQIEASSQDWRTARFAAALLWLTRFFILHSYFLLLTSQISSALPNTGPLQ